MSNKQGVEPIRDGEPIPGHYEMPLVKGGPMVPVRIAYEGGNPDPETGELTEDERFVCEVNGEDRGWDWCLERWPFIARRPIDEAEYRYRLDYGRWARTYRPDDPAANPTRADNIKDAPSIF